MTLTTSGLVEVSVCLTIASGSTANLVPVLNRVRGLGTDGTVIFNQAKDVGIGIARTGTTLLACLAGDALAIICQQSANIQPTNGSWVFFKIVI